MRRPQEGAPAQPPKRAALRRLLLGAVALATAIGAALLLGRSGGGRGRPLGGGLNVLLVTLDTTRADRLGCYGYRGAKTARLDRLAAEGVRFENAFTDAPITLPSHASLLTGLYPFEHGVRNNGNFYLPDRFETLATVLRKRGYRTAAFVSSFILDRRYGLARGFESYDDRMDEAAVLGSSWEAERRGDRTALACIRWLEGYAGQGAAAPFFVWLHLYDPHEPYRPPPPLRDLFVDRPYDGEIAFTDLAVASVLEKLAQLGLLDRSLVAVVADHGESLGDHGEETHSMFLYESAIRVPLILWRPGVLPAGKVVASPVRTLDLAPTILDILGEPPLAAPHARSLRGAIDGPLRERPPAVYAETYVPKFYMNGAALRVLREDRFKLIDAPRPELYDLAHDPGETQNRFEDEPAIAGRLRAELERLTAGGDAAMSRRRVDDEAVEKLKALGYLASEDEMARTTRDEEGKDPKDLIAVFNRLRRAERAARDHRFEDALPILRAVVAEEPRNAFAHMLLGSTHMGMRQYAPAIQQFQAYVALVPTSSQAHQSMAVGYANLGDQTSALREAGSALALYPHLSDARVLRAGILSVHGRRAEAVQELRAAVATDPEKPLLRLDLAEVLLDAGQAGEAEAEYRTVLKQDPAFAPALAGLGALLARRDALEEASGALRRALEVDPRQDEARFTLAQVLERQGRAAEARAEYERLARAADTSSAVRDAAKKRLGPPTR
jgi:arylsulfatase A-like enzyme/Tfp pilus assembly protein PilF